MNLRVRLKLGTLWDPPPQVTAHSALQLQLRWPALALAVLGTAWVTVAWHPPVPVSAPFRAWVGPSEPVPELPKPWPQSLAVEAARVLEGRFAPGSTLARELSRAGVERGTAHQVVLAAAQAIDLRRIRDGQQYRLYFDGSDRLTALRYQVNRQTAWFVAHEQDGWTTSKVSIPVRIRPTFISATIVDSLHRALERNTRDGASRQDLLLKVADIYGWDVDFSYDLRRGDRLDLVVEERFVEGEFSGYGDILAAEFSLGNRMVPVIRFQDAGSHVSYFRPGGESLRRTFLRSPVKYTRISSRFSPRRVHPATGVARAHRGVDYVAYPGTPVQATADGVVVEARYGREPGRYVRIRHGGSYSSVYMHLSRLHPNAKAGVEVRQGDIIGYVGKSGNATGYHLHYGLEQAGRYVDPISIQFPTAEPVPTNEWELFASQRGEWLTVLRQGQANLGLQIAGAGGM